MNAPRAPSGESFELRHGDQRAVVVEVGGGLRAYDVDGGAVLDGYAADAQIVAGRGQWLAPWPNRICDGRYVFRGEAHQLALTQPTARHAIHGLVRFANWAPFDRTERSISLRLALHPQPGYPFDLDLVARYALSDAGLVATLEATNVGDRACPYGAGAHPYVTVGTDTIDAAVLALPAAAWFETDARMIPTARRPVDGTAYDFRVARAIGVTRFDTCLTDLAREPDGRARVVLTHGTRRVTLWADASFGYFMLFSGDGLEDVGRRRGGLAVEPMTCAPNAFVSGDGLRVLEPGESFACTWGLRAEA